VATLKDGENIMYLSLQKKFPQAKEIKIKDISGNYITLYYIYNLNFESLFLVLMYFTIYVLN